MTDLNIIIANNIIALRKKAGMTQFDLAEKLNYSDKAISKWERGESVPDISVLKAVADLFGVTVDWLITTHDGKDIKVPSSSANKRRIAWLAVMGVWLIATTAFVTAVLVNKSIGAFWLSFVAAIPGTFIVLIVFNSIWGKPRKNQLYISGLIWTAITFVYLLLLVLGRNIWMLFLIGLPLQAATIIWHRMLKK